MSFMIIIVKDKDGNYIIVETKLTNKTPLTKGQKAASDYIKSGGQQFEIRSDIPQFNLSKGQTIEVKDYIRKNKYYIE